MEDATLRNTLSERARDLLLTEHNAWRTAERYTRFPRAKY